MAKLFSTKEAAQKCRVTENTILAWANGYGLGRRRDGRGAWGFTQAELDTMKGKRPLASKGDYVFARVMGEGVHAPLTRNLKVGDRYARLKVNGRSVLTKTKSITVV
jgi:hypothetical protein